MVTAVFISYKRLDLLERTIASFVEMNTYPLKEIIIADDSGDEKDHEILKERYPDYNLILNEKNMGAFENIDNALSKVTTPYIFLSEDDWVFVKPMFIERSLSVIQSNKRLMQVWISNHNNHPVDTEVYTALGVDYQLLGWDINHWWHGFAGGHPGIRCMEAYKKVAPWSQWQPEGKPLSHGECAIGQQYEKLGYRAAILPDTYCYHTGDNRRTWKE